MTAKRVNITTHEEHWSLQAKGTLCALSSSWDAVVDAAMYDVQATEMCVTLV